MVFNADIVKANNSDGSSQFEEMVSTNTSNVKVVEIQRKGRDDRVKKMNDQMTALWEKKRGVRVIQPEMESPSSEEQAWIHGGQGRTPNTG